MDEYIDIDTIDATDFNTPRTKNKSFNTKNSLHILSKIGSNHDIVFQSPNSIIQQRNPYSGQINQSISRDRKSSTLYTSPFQNRQQLHRQSSQDQSELIADYNTNKFSLNPTSQMKLNKQPLGQFSFSNETYEQITNQPLEESTEIRQSEDKHKIIQRSLSPFGIPYEPFHHTKSSFKLRNRLNETFINSPNQMQNVSSDDYQYGSGNTDQSQQQKLRNVSCMLYKNQNEDVINNYDQKILDINGTLKQLQAYKGNLYNMSLNHKKRSKSQHNNTPKIDVLKLPTIKSPNMYFSPMDVPSPKHQKKLKKAKKQKQQGLQSLAKQILNNLPQEKLANLMSINMYNQALMKKELNQDKITSVIEDQNKLLSKMLEQYESKPKETQKHIRQNLIKQGNDKVYETQKFEKDKRNFEKVYSNIQQRFQQELSQLPHHTLQHNQNNHSNEILKPLLIEGDLPDQIRNTKHLKRIHTHSQKYKQITPSKVHQPPMQF